MPGAILCTTHDREGGQTPHRGSAYDSTAQRQAFSVTEVPIVDTGHIRFSGRTALILVVRFLANGGRARIEPFADKTTTSDTTAQDPQDIISRLG